MDIFKYVRKFNQFLIKDEFSIKYVEFEVGVKDVVRILSK